jgi:hypothetical protein
MVRQLPDFTGLLRKCEIVEREGISNSEIYQWTISRE